MNKRLSVRVIAEIGVGVAMAWVLNLFKVFQMPQGGSVTLEMVPIFWLALRWGIIPGIAAGVVYGLVMLFTGAYVVHPIQFILDYPLAFGLLGLAGLFSARLAKGSNKFLQYAFLTLAVFLGGLGRFLVHFISGIVYFGQYAPEGQPVWLYSLIYNLTYILPELLISAIILFLLKKTLDTGEKGRIEGKL